MKQITHREEKQNKTFLLHKNHKSSVFIKEKQETYMIHVAQSS